MQAIDKVFMESPAGEIREVEATPEILTPLMATGWQQHHPAKQQPETPVEEGK